MESVRDLAAWLVNNKQYLDVIFPFITAIATVVIAVATIFNAWLIIETRRLRKAQTAPHLSLYFDWSISEIFIAHLIIRNDGFRQARGIKFAPYPDFWLKPTRKFSSTLFMQGLASLQPSEAKYMSMDTAEWFRMEKEFPDKKIPRHTTVTVTYQDIEGKDYKERFELDLESLKRTEVSGMPPSYMDNMAKSLENIAESLKALATKRLES
jgi:hypothetical protein